MSCGCWVRERLGLGEPPLRSSERTVQARGGSSGQAGHMAGNPLHLYRALFRAVRARLTPPAPGKVGGPATSTTRMQSVVGCGAGNLTGGGFEHTLKHLPKGVDAQRT